MNIRAAILEAADHIEANPALFKFFSTNVPECGTPGCAIGWIGHFFDAQQIGENVGVFSETILAIDETDFYIRMRDLQLGWMYGAEICAKTLRHYADKYYPSETERTAGVPLVTVANVPENNQPAPPITETFPHIMAELDRIFRNARIAA